MRVCTTICLAILFYNAFFTQKSVNAKDHYKKRNLIEAKQNVWELGDEFEGDILDSCRRNVRSNESYYWPNNTVPIEFNSFYDEKQRQWIMNALTDITNNSCVKFRLRTKDDKDYVFITEEKPGCNSYTGRLGGRQVMNLKRGVLGHGCFHKSVIVHEFMHVLGFTHQQSVYNRDQYITIKYENVKKGKERDFKLYSELLFTSFGEEYDYKSIMHYSSYAKSKNGKKTIEAKNSTIVIEKNTRLSKIDIRKLNKIYPCPGVLPLHASKQNIWELSGQYQGDIILSSAFTKKHRLWNNGEIPVLFDKRYSKQERKWIAKCLDVISEETCVTLRIKEKRDKDYVYIHKSAYSCSSSIGRVGGEQYLNLINHKLGKGCMSCGSILHEILHVLGLTHEQSRYDRNDYINILWNNIKPGNEYHFDMNNGDDDNKLNFIYDFNSLMHFSAYAFTKNGRRTIVPKTQSIMGIGRNSELSETDIAKIKKMYCQRKTHLLHKDVNL